MKAYQLLFFLVFASSLSTLAQTKVIAHKSHGGTMANFNLAMKSDIFDLNDSNFGEPPNPMVRYSIDTINILSDTSALITKGRHCYDYRLDSTYDEVEKDTLFKPIFAPINSKKDIKKALRDYYLYRVPTQGFDSAVIIGLDTNNIFKDLPSDPPDPKVTDKKESGQQNRVPLIVNLPNNPPSRLLWIGFAGIFLLSLFIGLWSKMRHA